MKELSDPTLKDRIKSSIAYKVQNRISSCLIPKLLPEEVDQLVQDHFKEGGVGYVDNKTSVFNMVKLGALKRTSELNDKIVNYLRQVSNQLQKLDIGLVYALVEKIQAVQFKAGETILKVDEDDCVQLIVLEGAVNKIKNLNQKNQLLIARFE